MTRAGAGILILASLCPVNGCGTSSSQKTATENAALPPSRSTGQTAASPPVRDAPDRWKYQMEPTEKGVVLDMEGVTVLFPGMKGTGRAGGAVTLTGNGRVSSRMSANDMTFVSAYENGVTTVTVNGRGFQLREQGTKLIVGRQVIDLTGERKKTVIVPRTGPVRVFDPAVLSRVPARNAYVGVLKVWSSGKQAAAEYLLEEFVRKYPDDQRLAFFQAACMRSRFDVEGAATLFEKVEAMDPASAEGRCANLVRALDSGPGNRNADFVALRTLVQENPNDPLLLWMLAVQCRARKRNEEGVRHFQRLLTMVGVGPVLAHQTYANLLDEVGRRREALPHRRLAVEQEPAEWSYSGLAGTLYRLGRRGEAMEARQKAQDMEDRADPDSLPPPRIPEQFSESERRHIYQKSYALSVHLLKEARNHAISENHPALVAFRKRYHLTRQERNGIDAEGEKKRWYFTSEQRRRVGLPP